MFDLAEAVAGTQLVLGDAVGVQAAGQRAVVEDRDLKALLAKLGGAGQACGAAADAGDPLLCARARRATGIAPPAS